MPTTELTLDERLIRPASMTNGAADGKPAFAELPLASRLNVDDEIRFVDDLVVRYAIGRDKKDKSAAKFQEIKDRVVERQRHCSTRQRRARGTSAARCC